MGENYNEAMDTVTAERLIALNRRFYHRLAQPFSDTRGRLQPGVVRVLKTIGEWESVLDLGCGNGELAAELEHGGHQGAYTGLDFSVELLKIAKERNYGNSKAVFHEANLTDADWSGELGEVKFDRVLCFASLHHVPSQRLRERFLKQVRGLLSVGGSLVLSNWQFLNSPRLAARVQDWERAEIDEADVDDGDYLLDWKRDGEGLRYVHHFDIEELGQLAEASGFKVEETFASDGQTGDLGLYQIWVAA
jgi:SAM-dependent methyltransferase